MRNHRIRSSFVAVLGLLVFGGAIAIPTLSLAQSTPTRICAYDANSGRPNPLGMRSFITAIEQDGNTTFRFEQFPSLVANPNGSDAAVTIATQRDLTFDNIGVDEARRLLRNNLSYYTALIGDDVNEGFATVDDVLVCRTASAGGQPTPGNPPPIGAPTPTIASLPNGVYRYLSGQATNRVYSDEELLSRGGVLFLFRKTGNQVTGAYSYIDGEAICVRGTLNGNTVSGQAFPYSRSIDNTGESFTSWGPARYLQVRRGQRAGAQSRYNSALLDLNGFSRINVGTRLPPNSCP